MDNDKATAIRAARQQLRAAGERESMTRVMTMVHSSKRTVKRYWDATDPEAVKNASPDQHEGQLKNASPDQHGAPAPEPAITLATLRAYYYAGGPAPWPPHGPWPQGGVPLEAYPLLTQLFKDADAQVTKGWQQWMAAKNAAGAARGTHDEPQVQQAEQRWSVQRLLQSRLAHDLDTMRQRAHYEGVTLS